RSEFVQPFQEATQKIQALMETGKAELLDNLHKFKAEQEARLAKVKVQLAERKAAEARRAAATHFRDHNYEMDEERIDELVHTLLKEHKKRSQTPGEWTNW
ncbi:MAG: hypothetical protein AB7K24_23675, partial [Gemmataceae bacterium]